MICTFTKSDRAKIIAERGGAAAMPLRNRDDSSGTRAVGPERWLRVKASRNHHQPSKQKHDAALLVLHFLFLRGAVSPEND